MFDYDDDILYYSLFVYKSEKKIEIIYVRRMNNVWKSVF